MTVQELIDALSKSKDKSVEVFVVDEQGRLTMEIASVDETDPEAPPEERQVNIIVEEWPSL